MKTEALMSSLRKGARTQPGFTLIELVVVIAIVAIMAAIAMPNFNQMTLGGKLSSISNAFVGSAQLARSEAIKRGMAVTLCASSDGATCGTSWSSGWVVLAGGNVILAQGALTTGFNLSGDVTSIVFQPSGVGSTQASLTVCRSSPTVGSQNRVVELSATGRPTVTKNTGVTTCS